MMDRHCASEEIQAYVDGELDGACLQECEGHLERCNVCARLAARLLLLSQSLAATGPQAPPADLRERILEAVARSGGVEPLECAAAREMTSAYVDDELTPAESARLEAHLFSCNKCYLRFRRTRDLVDSLRVVGPVAAPADMHERILAAVERAARPAPVFTWRRVAAAATGIAAAAAMWMAVIVPALRSTPMPMIAAAPVSVEAQAPMADDQLPAETATAVGESAPDFPQPADAVAGTTVSRLRDHFRATGRTAADGGPPSHSADTPVTLADTSVDPAPARPAPPVTPVPSPVAPAEEPVVADPGPAAFVGPARIATAPASVEPAGGHRAPVTSVPLATPTRTVTAPMAPRTEPAVTRTPERETVIASSRIFGRSEYRKLDVGEEGSPTASYGRMAEAINARAGTREWLADAAGIDLD